MITKCCKDLFSSVEVLAGICEVANSEAAWSDCGSCPYYENKWSPRDINPRTKTFLKEVERRYGAV